jgi:uncharacterized protein YeaO (DUF488 family)
MQTSYFAKYKGINAVSIALSTPKWYQNCRKYKKLAPSWELLNKYKQDKDEIYYTVKYYKEVLSKLDPQQVYEELGEDAVLLCWEKSSEFCHRFLIASWLEKRLGIEVNEID